MILADKWKDYELLDCGDGMKQERWGDVITVRPDPQVIWPRIEAKEWQEYDAFYHRSSEGGGRWQTKRKLPNHWTINYNELTFKISPTDFKHTGLFPEQAVNWEWSMAKIKSADRPIKVLNLFGYTGAATVAAASAGAHVTHVDAAKGMVNWCKENAKLSGLEEHPIRFIVDDCLKFVQREIRRQNYYDAIIMDPPSFGRGKQGEMWKIEKHLWELVSTCKKAMTKDPLYFLINSYTTGLSPTVLENILQVKMQAHAGSISKGEIGIPIKSDKRILPCGIFCRWESQ